MTRATIEDVAKHVGVTKSTVSHALSGKRPVAPETRRRIEEAIAELGYRPNPVAQRLAAGRTGAVGLAYSIAAERAGGEELAVLAAVSDALSAEGFALLLFAQTAEGAAAIRQHLESGLLDGLILGQVQAHDERVVALVQAGVPFVMLGRTADNSGLNYVDVDIEAAIEACVEHLVGLGHRQVAFFHEDAWASATAGRVLQAYERACARRRLRLIAPPCPRSPREVRTVVANLLYAQPGITALIAPGEAAASSAGQAATQLGRRIPGDFSLLCLGKTAAGALFMPETTGVDLRPAEQARQAAAMLFELLAQAAPVDRQLLLDPHWIAGETTGPV